MKRYEYTLLATLIFASSAIAAPNTTQWSYEGSNGPEHWGKLTQDFSLCSAGKEQSPINIQKAISAQHHELDLSFTQSRQEIVNNGHSIQINVEQGNTLKLDNDIYTLQQFHFHSPSENEINGKAYPLEAHFVYKSKSGALAVLAMMFDEGKNNSELGNAWSQLSEKLNSPEQLKTIVNLKTLLPESFKYYKFTGSLTTPPCSEDVSWLVIEQPEEASKEQILAFRKIIKHDNNRPIQKSNGRVIIDE